MLRLIAAGSIAIAAASAASAQEGGTFVPAAPADGYAAFAPEAAHVVEPGVPGPSSLTLDEALHCHAVGTSLERRAEDDAGIGAWLAEGFDARLGEARFADEPESEALGAVTLAYVSGYTRAELAAEIDACAQALDGAAPEGGATSAS
jgi:hypothetical protein